MYRDSNDNGVTKVTSIVMGMVSYEMTPPPSIGHGDELNVLLRMKTPFILTTSLHHETLLERLRSGVRQTSQHQLKKNLWLDDVHHQYTSKDSYSQCIPKLHWWLVVARHLTNTLSIGFSFSSTL